MNWLLIVGILIFSTAPLYARGQQQNLAKLKADARNVVGIIGGDKAKTQTYCQIVDLGRQMNQQMQRDFEEELDDQYYVAGYLERWSTTPSFTKGKRDRDWRVR
jgi:hypothetical protein